MRDFVGGWLATVHYYRHELAPLVILIVILLAIGWMVGLQHWPGGS
jgi:hypothetical protein